MAGTSRKAFEIFVSKIPWTVADRELKKHFGQFGPLISARLPFNNDTGFHKGFGWVSFQTEEGMNNALQEEQHILDKIKVSIQKNTPRLVLPNTKRLID